MVATRMRAGSVLLALVMSLLLVTVDAGPAYACSCMDVPLKNDIRKSDAVFSGEVRSIDEKATVGSGVMAAPGRITFAVEDSWKGVTTETVGVYGQGDGVNCYNLFEEGETYLVYASRAKEADAPLKNIGCGETRPLAGAEPDLRLLGPPVGGLPETGGLAPLPVGGTLLAMGVFSVAAACAVGVLSRPPRHQAGEEHGPAEETHVVAGRRASRQLFAAGRYSSRRGLRLLLRGRGEHRGAFRRSTAVFSAEVVESGELPMGQKGPMDPGMLLLGPVTLDVNAACKGVGGSSVVVHGQGPGASCGLDLERGETYLVFAGGTGRGGDGPLETGLCSATRQAGEETARNMSGPPTGTLPETGGVPLEGTARGTGPKLAAAAALIVSLAAGAIFAGRVACGLGR